VHGHALADRAKQKSLCSPDSTAGAFASTKRVFAQSSIKIRSLTEHFESSSCVDDDSGLVSVGTGRSSRKMTVETNAFVASATIFKYYEGVVFNISRAGGLRRQRSSGACPHGEERGEKYGDYR
jgi:hypothetical protein